jgi:hypothetical protein
MVEILDIEEGLYVGNNFIKDKKRIKAYNPNVHLIAMKIDFEAYMDRVYTPSADQVQHLMEDEI